MFPFKAPNGLVIFRIVVNFIQLFGIGLVNNISLANEFLTGEFYEFLGEFRNGNIVYFIIVCPVFKKFYKHTFGSLELAEYVKEKGYDVVEILGLDSDICVVSNALLIKAFCGEIPVSVDAKCCAGVTPSAHEAALTTMKSCQVQVV